MEAGDIFVWDKPPYISHSSRSFLRWKAFIFHCQVREIDMCAECFGGVEA